MCHGKEHKVRDRKGSGIACHPSACVWGAHWVVGCSGAVLGGDVWMRWVSGSGVEIWFVK